MVRSGVSLPRWRGRGRKVGYAALAIGSQAWPGVKKTSAEWRRRRKIARLATFRIGKLVRWTSSFLSVPKKLSLGALSRQHPCGSRTG